MIASGIVDDTEARTGNRGYQKEQADELQQQTPGLLDAAAMLELRAYIGADPETEGRYDLVALGAVEEIEGNDSSGYRAHQAEEFTETEI
jgi:hypothetical protein